MAIKFEKTQVKGGFPVFWRGEREVLPGDFATNRRGRYHNQTACHQGLYVPDQRCRQSRRFLRHHQEH